MLLILDPTNKWHRIIRRGLVIGALTAVAVMISTYQLDAPAYLVPVLAAVLATLDKMTRELKEKNNETPE